MGQKNSKKVANDVDFDFDTLSKLTGMSKSEISRWHKGFMFDCPHGYLTKKNFIKMYKELFPNGNPEKYADRLFKIFDKDNSKTIDFQEFMIACSLTSSADPKKKLELAFKIYDSDNSNTITKNEIQAAINAVNDLQDDDKLTPDEITKKVDTFMTRFDKNKDGFLSKDEFFNGVLSDADLLQLINFQDS